MVVQQHILNWLYSVLTSEYHDVNRTYNDVAQVLSQYPSLSPRTDVHTFPNGVSALLLHLTGTIPVIFRGNTYRFPISLWVPHAYPREPPLVYVTPTENMVVRPGQHVDPQGQVYHPYLVGWSSFWDKSTVLDFLAILRDVFAKEPPVVAKQQQPPQQQRQQAAISTPTPPPVPPLPNANMMARPASVISSGHIASPPPNEQRPPPPPPKGNDASVHKPSPVPAQPSSSGPPLPPHPGRHEAPAPQSHRLSRYDTAPPLPPQQPQHTGPTPPRPQYQSPPPAHGHAPYEQQHPSGYDNYHPSDPRRMSMQSQGGSSQPTPQPQASWNQQHQQPPPHQQPPQQQPPPVQQHAQQPAPHPQSQPPHPQYQQPPPQQQQLQQAPPQPVQPPPPPPDIMDEPLVLSLPSPTNIPAPPIPPNPERSNLLAQLATTLHAMRVRARTQNESSLSGLQAQRAAMLAALSSMHAEQQSLSTVSSLLSSNASILHDSLRKADSVVADAKAGKIVPPDVDELLVAPTVVANQLYDLVAEERALADAVFVLGRAVERGRVSPGVFAKTTRSLAREWYLKKALVKKIGRGMGLIQQ
ncbi:hypothetical protein PspLS_08649 [Pyricularia sp. CBS 133598]|nr:hypothetical protein PspLS_08649 [Pyricularia sp. CBS 133598]